MSKKEQFRMFYSSFWTDGQISEDLTPEDRYFYMYMLTNPFSTQLGVYEITRKQISDHLGYNIDITENLLKRFEDYHGLLKYNRDTKEVALLKWGKHNWRRGGKPVWDLVRKEIDAVKDRSLITLVAQHAPKSWLKDEIALYINAQCAGDAQANAQSEENSENSLALEPQGIEELCANAHDESYHNKEEIRNKNKTYMRNSNESLDNAFNEFWELYGIKKDRKRAFTAFKTQLKKYSLETILNGAKAYLKECEIKGTDKQYIKRPTTFLNGECFNDEYETSPGNNDTTKPRNSQFNDFNPDMD